MKDKIENSGCVRDKAKAAVGRGNACKVREVWDKPVSKRFYEKLRVKVSNIVQSLGYVRGYTDEIMKSLDRYMATGEVPMRYYCEEYFMALFYAIRVDVDEAMARSKAARMRAAERRARKLTERRAEESDVVRANTLSTDATVGKVDSHSEGQPTNPVLGRRHRVTCHPRAVII